MITKYNGDTHIPKIKQGDHNMSDIVSTLIGFIRSGDVESTTSICDDLSISVTHLMLASRHFVDPAQLAKSVTQAPTNARRGIVAAALINASKNQHQAEQANLGAAEQPSPLPFEPDLQQPQQHAQPQPEPQPQEKPTRTRRRAASPTDIKQVTLDDAVEQQAVESGPLAQPERVGTSLDASLDAVLYALQQKLATLTSVADEILQRQIALDSGVGKDLGSVLSAQASIKSSVDGITVELNTVKEMMGDALRYIDKFRSGTEALEIALIGKGLLDSAPFADSWHNN